jgi:hypothetical protein
MAALWRAARQDYAAINESMVKLTKKKTIDF